MTARVVALLLLAAAAPLWSAAGQTRARLATITGQRATPSAWRWWAATPARLLPPLFALSTGALLTTVGGLPLGIGAALVGWIGIRGLLRRRASRARSANDQLGVAATWDLLAACLRAGLPVPTAVVAVSGDLPREAADALRATADLLALGADPVSAWAPALDCAATAELARGARRTAKSGTALAGVAAALASGIRENAADVAEAKAQRVGVLITGPLGLCFLPAFVCLGIAPVVLGLATGLSVHQ